MHSVGVTDAQMRGLAALELLGALGLLVGIWVPFIGIAAAAGLTLYFLGAVVAHLRAKQPFSNAAAPLGLAVLALIVTVLEVAR
jgi:VIT1/CCC1 family predicted Fe2+/Mn2+ transporter